VALPIAQYSETSGTDARASEWASIHAFDCLMAVPCERAMERCLQRCAPSRTDTTQPRGFRRRSEFLCASPYAEVKTVVMEYVADPVDPNREWLNAYVILTPQRRSNVVIVRIFAVAESVNDVPG